MKIKKLEIKGFKSFPDKTVLEFRPGVTSIVGPNGCGKSNVLEALRWVMGEQRARTLRGKKMEDVIFNGSESRKPVGLAEVRLVLSNADGLGPPSMTDYDEIMIARRLFRDGDSQYEINNVACRLADVTDFFLDTGVGRNSYAIIEQGKVETVVAAKPEDRRVLLEEAAGVNRYKSRREAALKRLEQTNQNLVRIRDVIAEVRRQSNALKKQAAKAERYHKLQERVRQADLDLHAFRCNELTAGLSRVRSELEAARSELTAAEVRSAALYAGLEEARVTALRTEKELNEQLEARHRTDLDLAAARNHITSAAARITALNERAPRLRDDKDRAQAKLGEARKRTQELTGEQQSVRTEIESGAAELQRLAAAAKETEKQLTEQTRSLEGLREDIFTILQETAQQKNRRDGLARRAAEIVHVIQRNARDAESLRGRVNEDAAELARLDAALAENSSARDRAVKDRDELTRVRSGITRYVAQLRDEVGQLDRQLAAQRARHDSLEELEKEYHGYDESVRFLMKKQENGPDNGLLKPVAQIVDVPPEYQKALTAALGERLGHLVVDSPRTGIDAVNRLKHADAGRATLIPVTPRRGERALTTAPQNGLTRLRDVVSFREGFEHLEEFLLGSFCVTEDLECAAEVWERNGIPIDFATLDGDVLTRSGVITGGSHHRQHEELFDKRREREALGDSITDIEERRTDKATGLSQQEALLERTVKGITDHERSINELTVAAVHLGKDRERLHGQTLGSQRRLDVLVPEREHLLKEQEKLHGEVRKSDEALALLEKRRTEGEARRAVMQRGLEDLSGAAKESTSQIGELRVTVAQREERNRSIEKELTAAQEAIRQSQRRFEELEAELRQDSSQLAGLADEVEMYRDREEELMETRVEQSLTIEKLRDLSTELAASVRAQEEDATKLDKRIRAQKDAVHTLELDAVKLEQAIEGIVDRISERYRIDPRTVPCPSVPPEESQLEELRDKLQSMGEVNLAALAESRLVEERLTFLSEQEDDLKQAVESLYSTINAINGTTRERFRDAFDRVNEKFQEIFPFLFGGGEARLELTDEDDLLETGVEIMARPPGKRVRNMDLLSGGEKALTAVALIFAIFLIRPSPFCLLDEVDAPLDDANLGRFNEMLQSLSSQTQFLVITHNKMTMQAADCLYGVTMEEPGVSRVVSVEFV